MTMTSTSHVLLLVVAVAWAGCEKKQSGAPEDEPPPTANAPSPVAPVTNTSRDQFLARGNQTFVLGTAGDGLADHRIATQVALMRGLALPDSALVDDTSIDVSQGASAWPANPVLYGGPHENTIIAALAPSLPFRLGPNTIEIGGTIYEGDGYRLTAVVPARAADDHGPGYPEFVLFAGTGPGGIAEINAGLPGGSPIAIGDAFGGLIAGVWKTGDDGALVADVSLAPGRRIAYRNEERQLASVDGVKSTPITFAFPKMVEKHSDENDVIDACMRGLATVVRKLEISDPVPVTVYVYPDARSKAQLTGSGGQGHAVPSARALHVLQLSGEPLDALEGLVAHEATHVLGYYAWGPAGTAMMGEGLAVWVSGRYQAHTVHAWRSELAQVPTVEEMTSISWMTLPEMEKYPAAAILVDEAMTAVGADKVREHLLGATFETWPQACANANTSAAALQRALASSTKAE